MIWFWLFLLFCLFLQPIPALICFILWRRGED